MKRLGRAIEDKESGRVPWIGRVSGDPFRRQSVGEKCGQG